MQERSIDDYDVLVAGAGPIGITAALACAQLGLRTCIAGKAETRDVGRTVALLEGSLQLFQSLGLRSALEAISAPLEVMRIVDDTDSIFRVRPAEFRSAEMGLAAFGRNVENVAFVAMLLERAAGTSGLSMLDCMVEGYEFLPDRVRARIQDRTISAKLLIAADGGRSPARAAAGIEARTWAYPQSALTSILAHERPHQNVSTEFHARGGPFTLVPLPASKGDRWRSSLVWMTTHEEARRAAQRPSEDFADEVERRAHSLLGKMRLISPIGVLPMSGLRAGRMGARRTALAGDAAHGFPPIGAQGLNLGLRDIAVLINLLGHAPDPGAQAVLERYDRQRAGDVGLRTLGVDLVNRSLLIPILPIDLARGMGLLVLKTCGPLRRAAMRLGLAQPPLSLPTARRRHALSVLPRL